MKTKLEQLEELLMESNNLKKRFKALTGVAPKWTTVIYTPQHCENLHKDIVRTHEKIQESITKEKEKQNEVSK